MGVALCQLRPLHHVHAGSASQKLMAQYNAVLSNESATPHSKVLPQALFA
jgi:hypothetical protein